MVLIIVPQRAELAVAQAPVEGDGALVVDAHLQSHDDPVRFCCLPFRLTDKGLTQAAPAHLRSDGNGIDSCQAGVGFHQHQAVAHQLAFFLRQDDPVPGHIDKTPKTASGYAVLVEASVFQAYQGIGIGQGGIAKNQVSHIS